MNELYAETGVKRKTTASVIMLKMLAVLAIILVLLFSFVIKYRWFVMVPALLVVFVVWYWPRFKTEWEYVFCDGQLDFDMIMGGEKRRNVLRMDLEDAYVMAPENSHALDGYQHLKVRDYSSMRADHTKYVIVVAIKEEKVRILFEPNEKMIRMMKEKSPQKVVEV